MKNKIFALVFIVLCAFGGSAYAADLSDGGFYFNDMYIETEVATVDGETLLPLKTLAEQLFAYVEFDANSQKITIEHLERIVILNIDSKIIYVDGVAENLNVAPQTINGTTYVPLELAEFLYCLVVFDQDLNCYKVMEERSASYGEYLTLQRENLLPEPFSNENTGLFLNGEQVDAAVILENSSILLPLRLCGEMLDATVDWQNNDENQSPKITITKDETSIILTLNSQTAFVNGEEIQLAVAPKLVENTCYVPLRGIFEQLNNLVLYNGEYDFVNLLDMNSPSYEIYCQLESDDILERRFAQLAVPRIENVPDIVVVPRVLGNDADKQLSYIFPVDNGENANYFLRYEIAAFEGSLNSCKYYEVVDGVAVNTWGSFGSKYTWSAENPNATHILFAQLPKTEFKTSYGDFPELTASSYLRLRRQRRRFFL